MPNKYNNIIMQEVDQQFKFQTLRGDYWIMLDLKSEPDQSLLVYLHNTENLQCFEGKFNTSQVSEFNDPDFGIIYDDVKQFYDQLKELLLSQADDAVKIRKDGQMKFSNGVSVITLQLELLEIDKVMALNRLVFQLCKEMHQLKGKTETRQGSKEQLLLSEKSRMESVSEILQSKRENISSQMEKQLSEAQSQVEVMKKELRAGLQNLKKQNILQIQKVESDSKLNFIEIQSTIDTIRQKVSQIQYRLSKALEEPQELMQNSQLTHKILKSNLKKERVSFNNVIRQNCAQDKWRRFIAQKPVTESVTYRIKMTKVTKQFLWFGLGTDVVFGAVHCEDKPFLNYEVHCQKFHENGVTQIVPNKVQSGSILHLKYDSSTHMTIWRVDGAVVYKAQIPDCMREKNLYFMLCLKFYEDEVQLSVE